MKIYDDFVDEILKNVEFRDGCYCGKKHNLVFRIGTEAIQDIHNFVKCTYSIRTSPITQEEIDGWKDASEWLNELDLDELKIKHQIKIESEFVPYENW